MLMVFHGVSTMNVMGMREVKGEGGRSCLLVVQFKTSHFCVIIQIMFSKEKV